MGQITNVQKSIFKAGDIVVVNQTGNTYSTYKKMAEFLGLTQYIHGKSPLNNGDRVTVLGSAMHESSSYGEVVGVRTACGQDVLIGAKGLSEPQTEDGKPRLNYNLVPLTTIEGSGLEQYIKDAPSWATHVGQDYDSVFFFDHSPYAYNSNNFVKGLLPKTHRFAMLALSCGTRHAQGGLIAIKLPVVPVVEAPQEPTYAELQAQVAELKAKLWKAEYTINTVKKLVE